MKLDANAQIREFLFQKHISASAFAKLWSEKTGKKCSRQNLSNRMRKGTIRYDEMLEIADILGFEIEFKEKAK